MGNARTDFFSDIPQDELLVHSMVNFFSIFEIILDVLRPNSICEIGIESGKMTSTILDYCKKNNCLYVGIDPHISEEAKKILSCYKSENVLFHEKFSVEVLKTIPLNDIYFIDGDHNYYTVYNEVSLIIDNMIKSNKPACIFYHDISWPCGRRDFYYNPNQIPDNFLHEYEFGKGVILDSEELMDDQGFESCGNYAIACKEGGEKSGVLTGIEDAIKNNALEIEFLKIPCIFGLGILYPIKLVDEKAKKVFDDLKRALFYTNKLFSIMEYNRIKLYLDLLKKQRELERAARLSEQIAVLNKTVENLKMELDEKERKLKESDQLSEQITILNTNIDSLKTELDYKSKEVDKLSNRVILKLWNKIFPEGSRKKKIMKVLHKAVAILFGFFKEYLKNFYYNVGRNFCSKFLWKFNLNKYLRLIDRSDCLSLDVFDTAIIRLLKDPKDLFIAVQEKLKSDGVLDEKLQDYKTMRIDCEKLAREKKIKKTGNGEINIHEIFDVMKNEFSIPQTVIDKAIETEIEFEKIFCKVNPEIFKLYEYASKKNKKVIFISDMYLGQEIIIELLCKNGYRVDNNNVFVSNSFGYSKGDDKFNLFKQVLKIEGISKNKMVHVGDNYYADFKMCKNIGIKTFRYIRIQDRMEYFDVKLSLANSDNVSRLFCSYVQTLCQLKKVNSPQNSICYRLGYNYLGPLYTAFTCWFSLNAKRLGIEHLYFPSRDGFIIKRIYEKVKTFKTNFPQSTYLCVSRRAIFMPSLENIGDFEMTYFCGAQDGISISEILERINININDVKSILGKYELLNAKEKLKFYKNSEHKLKLNKLFNDEGFKKIIFEKRDLERENFKKYLEQEGMLNFSKIGFIDIGWNASSQYYLSKFLKSIKLSPTKLMGYYIATFPSAEKVVDENTNLLSGYLCNFGKSERVYNMLLNFEELFEIPSMARHGTVLGYKKNASRITAVFDKRRFSKNMYMRLSQLQQGILNFSNDFFDNANFMFDIASNKEISNVLIEKFHRLIYYPTKKESISLGDLEHNVGIGKEINMSKVAYNMDFKDALRNLIFKSDSCKEIQWIFGFVKRQNIFFRLILIFRMGWTTALKNVLRSS